MKTLLKNASVINVFTDEIEKASILFDETKILGVGDYHEEDADYTEDLNGKFVCPGFIDGHIHIESTMLHPEEFARVCVPHGTTAVAADPHEIANVCGTLGLEYMLNASENLPMDIYFTLPSCVPSTKFDENGAVLNAVSLKPFYEHPRVIGLGEVMDYPAVIQDDPEVYEKIKDAHDKGKIVCGHAPMLTGKQLEKYIAAGIQDDHECSTSEEAKEKIRKGQWVMIRQGTAARNLQGLVEMFEEPWSRRCVFVTDDRHPTDLLNEGHIDNIIREAVTNGASVLTAIRMATIQSAQCLGLSYVGAIAPGFRPNLLILDNLQQVSVCDVYYNGKLVVKNHKLVESAESNEPSNLPERIFQSFFVEELTKTHFYIEPKSSSCRVIQVIKDQLITYEKIMTLDFTRNNGIDPKKDILKLAVIERHHNTGHIGLGYITGIELKSGAIASSIAHDTHNIIVIAAGEEDMVIAANRIREIGGGCVVVNEGRILAEMPLPIAGLMSNLSAKEVSGQNENVRNAVYEIGANKEIEPFMTMAFVSLPVIPNIKMTTKGLVDVNRQELVSLFVTNESEV